MKGLIRSAPKAGCALCRGLFRCMTGSGRFRTSGKAGRIGAHFQQGLIHALRLGLGLYAPLPAGEDHRNVGIPVHQLVMLAFHGYPPAGMEARHLNGIPTDNRPENLCYGTHSENMIDMYRDGKGRIALTPEAVQQIRFGLACGWPVHELACMYGVSDSCIRQIRGRRRYAWVA